MSDKQKEDAVSGYRTEKFIGILDTHIILWALDDNPKLPEQARALIMDVGNEVKYSIIISIKIVIILYNVFKCNAF